MWTATIIVILIVLFLLYRKKQFSFFKELGIPGPEPNLLFGNFLEIYRKDPIECHKEWIKKYGKILGYYNGTKPTLLVTDVELLKKVQVSDFHKFMNRPNMFRGEDRDPTKKPKRVEGFSQQLVMLRDKRWKEIRSLLTPSFTTSKMKQMTPIMNDAIESLLQNVEKKSTAGESFDIYSMYQGLTMDIIGRTAFGIQTDCQNDPNDPLLKSARFMFSGNIQSPLSIIAVSFRKLERLWSMINRMRLRLMNQGKSPVTELIKSVRDVIALRRKDKSSRRSDLLQLMIDAEADVTSVTSADLTATDDTDTTEEKSSGTTSEKLLRKMTDDDILDNSVLFFLAGYETTSTALAFTTHFLIHHQDVQEKVSQEVRDLLEKEEYGLTTLPAFEKEIFILLVTINKHLMWGDLDYYSVNKLQYLDQVLHESLRMYPPIHLFVNRESAEDYNFGKFQIKKGLAIQVPVFNLHRDSDLWPEPEEFNPERFSPENKNKHNPLAYQPFGAGPRNCVGMRFALMEAKLALSKLLSKYKLKPCAETDKEKVTLRISAATICPKHGVYLKAVPA